MENQTEPKLFVSYSWSNPDHEAWVLQLSEELSSQGIDVILDKWDLQPGHDANAFMEGMITDQSVTKVIIICDKLYTSKSNSRSRGAGTEAQIISPELYAKKTQDKYVAVIRERDEDGNPYLPAYYGSRIYIDLSDPSTYSTEFDKLVRWAWDKPLHVRPTRGTKPTFVDSADAPKIATNVTFRRAAEGVRNNAQNSRALVADYLNVLATGLEAFRVSASNSNRNTIDDQIVSSIDDFIAHRNEFIEMMSIVSQHTTGLDFLSTIHRFFESVLPYTERPANIHQWIEAEFDNFRFIVHELFLYAMAVFLRHERFDAFTYMVENEYYWEKNSNSDERMHLYIEFRQSLESLRQRNARMNLRRLSIHSDMLKARNAGSGIDFQFLMSADFILYLRSADYELRKMWWPETLLYAERFRGAFEVFARSKSRRYFDRVKSMVGVASKAQLEELLQKINLHRDRIPRWEFNSINPNILCGFEMIATIP